MNCNVSIRTPGQDQRGNQASQRFQGPSRATIDMHDSKRPCILGRGVNKRAIENEELDGRDARGRVRVRPDAEGGGSTVENAASETTSTAAGTTTRTAVFRVADVGLAGRYRCDQADALLCSCGRVRWYEVFALYIARSRSALSGLGDLRAKPAGSNVTSVQM